MTSVRQKIVQRARWGVANTAQIHYRESRPMPLTSRLPLTTDCSGYVTLCYFLSGAPDPNGLGYNGEGYTGTLLEHGQHISLSEVEPGDVIVYGPGTGVHTAVIVEAGADPLTVSHGQEADPAYVRVSQDGRKPQRYLRFPTTQRETRSHKPHGPLPNHAPKPAPAPANVVVVGPKGGTITRASLARALRLLPALLRRFHRVTLLKK